MMTRELFGYRLSGVFSSALAGVYCIGNSGLSLLAYLNQIVTIPEYRFQICAILLVN